MMPIAKVSHGYSTTIVNQVQEIIDKNLKGEIGPNTALWDIWEILASQKTPRAKKIVLRCGQVACHPSNRGTFGLNGYNCHKNGNEIDKVGVDLNMLNMAMCFQLCPIDPNKTNALVFNRKVIKQAKGLLADLTGEESHISVGTGHFTGWCRAIKAGCRTPFKHLQDDRGCLSEERFARKCKRMATLLEDGWEWFELPWEADIAWPQLADLAQRALNSSQTVSSRSTELEVMVSMAQAFTEDESVTMKTVCEMTKLNGPQCSPYIESVGELATQISGGAGAPTLHFLDRFQKNYGANKDLGEEFCVSLVRLFYNMAKPHAAENNPKNNFQYKKVDLDFQKQKYLSRKCSEYNHCNFDKKMK